MLKYYIDYLNITIPTLEEKKEFVIALLIDENLKLVTYALRESEAYEVLMTKAFYKLGFEPEVKTSIITDRFVHRLAYRIRSIKSPMRIETYEGEDVYNNHVKLSIDRVIKSFVHEYKPNSEMKAGEKRIGTDGKMYQARYALNCQDCCFESDACLHLQIGLGSCSAGNRLNNHDNIIFKIIE